MGEAKRRRDAAIRALAEVAGGDMGLAAHMYDQQVRPQELAKEMRGKGEDVEVVLANVSDGAPGFEVSCYDCGRTATLPFKPPSGKQVLCPQCQRKSFGQ